MKFDFNPYWLLLLFKLAKYVIVPAAGLGGGWLTRRWMISRSANWPTVTGTVQSVNPAAERSGALAQLSYSYVVEGGYYAGTLLAAKTKGLRTLEDVRLMFPPGSSIDVRYSPKDHGSSLALLPELIVSGGFAMRA